MINLNDMMSHGAAKWIAYTGERDKSPKCPWTLSEKERENMKKRGEYLSATLPWTLPCGETEQHEPIADTSGIALFSCTVHTDGVISATVDATALGIFDLYINGQRVGRNENGRTVYDEFKPGWTDYRKRVLFYSYDITDLLRDGDNTVLASVAPGWWNGKISNGTYGGSVPKWWSGKEGGEIGNHVSFLASMHIIDKNGTRTVLTDENWMSAWGSSIRAADLWDGEIYDANYPTPAEISADPSLIGWQRAGTEEHNISVTQHKGPTVRIREHLTQSVRSVVIFDGTEDNGTELGRIHTVRSYSGSGNSFSLKKGECAVVDFGQNMTGYPSLKVRGSRGTTVQLRTGEMLNDTGSFDHGNDAPAGAVYSSNLRAAKSKAYYILNGNENGEKYHPTYTFFGYRYLEISATDDIEVSELCSLAVGSDIRETGHIETSSGDVNQLISNIIWGQRSNYLSIPTDCPQRDERLGWTGDTQAFCCTAAYNGDVLAFLRQWLMTARDSQNDDGQYPDIIPREIVFGEGAAAWGDAGVIVPYILWRMYGDTSVIEEHFASMEKYMDWLSTRGYDGPKAVYCDWLSVEETDGSYISAVYYALDAAYLSEMAHAIGRDDRARYYAALKNEIASHFREKYCDENGDLKPEHRSQTCCLLALKHGLLLPENRQTAIDILKNSIISRGYHLSTGFVGTSIINDVLARVGEMGLAYSLLMQTGMPSWLYCVRAGATTVWERWDSFTAEHGFNVYGVDSSFNHYAYGALEEWIYRHVAGIDTKEPGFTHPLIAPKPDTRKADEIPAGQERLTWVKASFDSPNGMIKTEWNTENGFTLDVTVPVPSTVHLPLVQGKNKFTINGEEHCRDEYPRTPDGGAVIEIAAGAYRFCE